MPYCPRCGTENDPSAEVCPLCDTRLPRFDDQGPGTPAYPPVTADDPARVWLTPRQRRHRVFAVVGFLLLFPVIVVTGVDLLINGVVTWSWIPDVALVGLFAVVAQGYLLRPWPFAVLAGWAMTSAGLVMAIDALESPGLGWFWSLGLPLAVWVFGLLAAGEAWLRTAQKPGWNLFGYLALGLALGCAGIEFVVRWHLVLPGGFWWSSVTALALVPLGLLFLVVDRLPGRRLNLRQTFHL